MVVSAGQVGCSWTLEARSHRSGIVWLAGGKQGQVH